MTQAEETEAEKKKKRKKKQKKVEVVEKAVDKEEKKMVEKLGLE